jgi:hypothetical protein
MADREPSRSWPAAVDVGIYRDPAAPAATPESSPQDVLAPANSLTHDICSSRPPVSSLSAAIPYAASRHTAVPASVTLLSRGDVVPCKAATDLAMGRAWPDTEEVTGSNPVAPTTPLLSRTFVRLSRPAGGQGDRWWTGSAAGEHFPT